MNKNIYNEQAGQAKYTIGQSILDLFFTRKPKPSTEVFVRRTQGEVQGACGTGEKITMIATYNERSLIERLHKNESMLLATVLSMLGMRFRESNQDAEKLAEFEKQLTELDRHIEALSLYSTDFGETYDLPHPREYIESLMMIPKMVDRLFSNAGFGLTVFIPLEASDQQMILCFAWFARRTGVVLEVVSPT